MASDISAFRPMLKSGDFGKLFNELGWDKLKTGLTAPANGTQYALAPIAEKRGVQIFQCAPNGSGKIPEYSVRRKIEAEVTKSAYHHVIIFTDAKKTTQIWQWVAREAGKPIAYREQTYHIGQSGDALLQKLDRISFSLSEEEGLKLTGVTVRLKDAFDKDKVTKKFYDRFQKEHTAFLGFIQNIPDSEFQRWYASVMINRLMFLYFIQAKGFLDSDVAYLQNKLKQSEGHFYRDFLCPLFFEGFAQREHSSETTKKLGQVPYLNGGLFTKHQIEEKYGSAITIPDEAFEKLFAFFDGYNWHLDDRPLKNDKEINPDVLGYIFEKYINQKQMGAYYTKEDITEYIGKNTILPFLLDRAREDCLVAFEGEDGLWRLLREDPGRYIYPAVKRGTELTLPDSIRKGVESMASRGEWNKPALPEYALPTEIWREVVTRRLRYQDVRKKLAAGELRDSADLITYNLHIRQFAQDCIEQGGPEFLLAVWNVLNGTPDGRLPLSILDPTCGSGAFLFAALEILEPLYEACLDRMASFVSDADQLGHSKDHLRFRAILDGAAVHSDRRYFILKSIIVNNLFGVDIMEEATEICKLRLFLKLAAQVEADPKKDNFGIEPLPDIDFNIRAGNTLVGFATEAQTEKAVTISLDYDNAWPRIQDKAAEVARTFEEFQKSQNDLGTSSQLAATMKKDLQDRMKPLREELDGYLGQQYGKIGKDSQEAWKTTAQPFHWFIEFYRVMKAGGFDVIIGNPPYVEYSKVKTNYQVKNYITLDCGNLYAFTLERSIDILHEGGRLGLIVPISSFATARMGNLQRLCDKKCEFLWISSYGIRPTKLFEGAEQRLSILLSRISHQVKKANVFTTKYIRWNSEERGPLLSLLGYQNVTDVVKTLGYAKISTDVERLMLSKLPKRRLGQHFDEKSQRQIYWHRIPGYFIKALDFIPYFHSDRDGEKKSEDYKIFGVREGLPPEIIVSLLNSSFFYWLWFSLSEGYHCGKHEVLDFPFDSTKMTKDTSNRLATTAISLMIHLKAHAQRRVRNQKTTVVEYDEFSPSSAKPIIDQIDRALAQHYGFTDEETDFIINYDIKYRMGRGGDEAGEEE